MPLTKTKAAATNNHGYLRDTHASFGFMSSTVLVVNPVLLMGVRNLIEDGTSNAARPDCDDCGRGESRLKWND